MSSPASRAAFAVFVILCAAVVVAAATNGAYAPALLVA